jgi:hypothetical protein
MGRPLNLLEVLGRCRLPHSLVVWCAFPWRVGFLLHFGWCTCRVSIMSFKPSVPSFNSDFGVSWCVLA